MTERTEKRFASLAECIRYFRAPGESVFAVVDAARDRKLAWVAHTESTTRPLSLFNPPGARCMTQVAPYVAPLDPAGPLAEAWSERLGDSVGLIVVTAVTMRELRVHLRSLFVVTDPKNETFFFRFYDPRVLRTYLPGCTPPELKTFFGPMRRVLCDAEKPGQIVSYSPGQDGLDTREMVVQPAAVATAK